MLHNEARALLVGGYEATHDAEGIAKAYSVSKWTVYRLAEQKRKTGSVALRTSQRGRKPVLTAADQENIRHTLCTAPLLRVMCARPKHIDKYKCVIPSRTLQSRIPLASYTTHSAAQLPTTFSPKKKNLPRSHSAGEGEAPYIRVAYSRAIGWCF